MLRTLNPHGLFELPVTQMAVSSPLHIPFPDLYPYSACYIVKLGLGEA